MSQLALQVSWGRAGCNFQYGDMVWVRRGGRVAYVAACPSGSVSEGQVPVLYIDLPPGHPTNREGLPFYQVPLDDIDLQP